MARTAIAAVAVCAIVWAGIALWPSSHRSPASGLERDNNPIRTEARGVVDRLWQEFPSSPDAICVCGIILNRFGSSQAAVDCWQQCLDMAPNFADAYFWLGWDALRQGEFQQATSLLREAVDLGTTVDDARLRLAEALTNSGRLDEAVTELESFVDASPTSTEGLVQLGQAYERTARNEDALAIFEKAIAVDPKCTFAWYGIAKTQARLGDADRAKDTMSKFQALKQQEFAADQQEKRNYDDEAELRSGLADAYELAAGVYARHGVTNRQLECLEQAAKSDPKHVSSRQQLFSLYRKQNRPDDAARCLEQLFEIQPDQILHGLNLGVLRCSLGQYEQAQAVFQQVIDRAPDRSEGYGAMSQLYLQSGQESKEAVRLARKAVALDATAANYQFLSAALARSGDLPGAATAIEQAIRLAPQNAQYREIHNQLTSGLKAAGDSRE